MASTMRPATALFSVPFVTALIIAAPLSLTAQKAQAPPSVKRETPRSIQSVQGKDIYAGYCAVCHGVDLKGHGPAAAAMKVAPTDLTTYAQRHGGKFSDADMRMVIEGQTEVVAHGSRDMPIWGDVFRALTHGHEERELRMKNLIDYLKQMQAK
jgi:mono/diheme cytochrome c family protein